MVIRRLGSYAGTRVFFGYDRYLLPEVSNYREVMAACGEVVEPIDVAHLHYLTSAELVCTAIQEDVVDGQDVFGILICGTGMGMSIAAMVVAAFGFLAPVAGALLQEGIDVAVTCAV